MTWSYSGNPADSSLDEVRFLAQLTDTNEQNMSNEEITYILTKESGEEAAAARCCEILAVRYSREADIVAGANGELSIKFSQLSDKFSKIAKELRASSGKLASPWAGSISVTEKEDQEDRDDRVVPSFARDQFDQSVGEEYPTVKDWNNEGAKE